MHILEFKIMLNFLKYERRNQKKFNSILNLFEVIQNNVNFITVLVEKYKFIAFK